MPSPKPEIFADEPWRALDEGALGMARTVPTMLSKMEQLLYLWIGECWATGEGAIVDLGSFVGGSTARLAEGQRRAFRTAEVHAFDRFGASESVKELLLYPNGIAPFEGKDIYPLAQRLLAPWAPDITLHKGRIEEQIWLDGPIEVLAIDAAKTAKGLDVMAEIFFPALVPGRSIVVQQDFLHWKVPWIPAQMELMADWFQPVAFCPHDTVVYLCTAEVDEAALAAGRVSGLSDETLIKQIDSARLRLRQWDVDLRLQAAAEAVLLNPGKRKAKDIKRRPPRLLRAG